MSNDNNTIQFPDEPNREYIRKFKKAFNMQGKTNEEVKQLIELLKEKEKLETLQKFKETFKYFKEGDNVRLNIESIKSHPDYPRLTEKYRKFVDDNADKVFTVEYDPKHQNNPALLCLKEDPTDPKWLWWEGNLELVKEEIDNENNIR